MTDATLKHPTVYKIGMNNFEQDLESLLDSLLNINSGHNSSHSNVDGKEPERVNLFLSYNDPK